MIRYESGKFGMWFAWQLSGSVVPKALLIALPASIVVIALRMVVPLITDFHKDITYSTPVNNLWNGFNLILGFLIVFRSQQAYSRSWEGGTLLKQMRGDWFNAYSSLLAFTNPAPEKQEEVAIFCHQIVRLFSLLHSSALEYVTDMERLPLETIDLQGFDEDKLRALRSVSNKVEVILQWLQKLIIQGDSAGIIKVAAPILSRVFNDLGNGIVQCNNAKKIGDYMFPFPIAQLMAILLVFHLVFTIYVSVIHIPGHVSAFCATFAVLFAFWSINLVSIEIEMPFGDDLNDLPLADMQADFNLSLSTLLEPSFITPPEFRSAPESDLAELMVCTISLDSALRVGKRSSIWSSVSNVRREPRNMRSLRSQARKDTRKRVTATSSLEVQAGSAVDTHSTIMSTTEVQAGSAVDTHSTIMSATTSDASIQQSVPVNDEPPAYFSTPQGGTNSIEAPPGTSSQAVASADDQPWARGENMFTTFDSRTLLTHVRPTNAKLDVSSGRILIV